MTASLFPRLSRMLSIDPFSAMMYAGIIGCAALCAAHLATGASENSAATQRRAAMTSAPNFDARRRAAAVILFHSTADELPRLSAENRECVDEAVRVAY